jgi:NNP family nitrate/nitrite transporter-like MFS transporter
MRAFHCAWWGFFIAFFIWFAVAPLQTEIKKSLKISKQDLWTSSIVGLVGTIIVRFLLGPLTDKYGPRLPFLVVLCFAAIPTALTGTASGATSLSCLRFFIGVAGGSFVMCQYWTSRMFTKEIVGTANAIVAGWGNLGGGVTQLLVGSALFPLFKVFTHGNADLAWRTVFIVPAAVAFLTGIMIYFISDDAPKGNYSDLKKLGNMPEVSAGASFRSGALNLNSWLLFIQYACSFGVE